MKLFARPYGLALLAALLLTLTPAPATAKPRAPVRIRARGMAVTRSRRSFDDTWNRLIDALDANPNIRIIAQIDHSKAASTVGLTLPPNRVVVFGNPALGTPIMTASRTAGLDLPQKMHVWAMKNKVFVGYNPVSYLRARHGTGDVATFDTVANALAALASVATGRELPPLDRARGTRVVAARPGVVTTASKADFETTWARLLAAIEGSPASVAFKVDHAANSGGVLPATRLVVFGNPRLGTPLMQAAATAGIDLPLKVLVWVDDGGVTQVSTTTVRFLKLRHRLRRVNGALGSIDGAVGNFVAAATGA